MDQQAAKPLAQWRYVAVINSLILGVLFQAVFLPCACYRGTANFYMVITVDLLIILRVIIARIRKERNKGWIFYLILPHLIIPVILLANYLWIPH